MPMSESLVGDLHNRIKAVTGSQQPRPERRFHKHDEYLSYGLKTPDFRRIMSEFRPRIITLSLQDRLDLAARLLSYHIGELGHAGIHVVALGVEELQPLHLPLLDRLVDDFRSWSHVDHFCSEVMQPLLWEYQAKVLALLWDWNGSSNRWKRRASVVVFTRSVGESGAFTDEVLKLCENLIWDEEDIVQKGVGWALKDNLRSAPDRIIAYVKDLRRRGASSTVTLYAIRDLKGAEREAILAVKRRKPCR
jgi:3-methyladenine DNA glycosylase AlkD